MKVCIGTLYWATDGECYPTTKGLTMTIALDLLDELEKAVQALRKAAA